MRVVFGNELSYRWSAVKKFYVDQKFGLEFWSMRDELDDEPAIAIFNSGSRKFFNRSNYTSYFLKYLRELGFARLFREAYM